jgi:hypothetical protein
LVPFLDETLHQPKAARQEIETYGGYSAIDKQNRDPGEDTVSEAMTGRDIRLPGILY